MEQFEKVCKGLECCVLRDPDDHRRCGECPYNPHAISNEPCANGLKYNALALINAQQKRIAELEAGQTARVMSLEEAIEAVSKDGGIVWIEQKSHPLDVAHVLPTNHICDSPQRKFQDYGKEFVPKRYSYRYMWRCWTSWPTDEQMKETKWE